MANMSVLEIVSAFTTGNIATSSSTHYFFVTINTSLLTHHYQYIIINASLSIHYDQYIVINTIFTSTPPPPADDHPL